MTVPSVNPTKPRDVLRALVASTVPPENEQMAPQRKHYLMGTQLGVTESSVQRPAAPGSESHHNLYQALHWWFMHALAFFLAFHFVCISVIAACMSAYHVCTMSMKVKRGHCTL